MTTVVTTTDEAYYRERLADVSLLSAAVVLPGGVLAVPCGAGRQGGFANPLDHRACLAMLEGRTGFPAVRIELGDDEVADQVIWGAEPPSIPAEDAMPIAWALDEIRRGRFYGYSDAAIEAFVRDSWGPELASKAKRLDTATRAYRKAKARRRGR